jgi:hypothetical protein
MERTEAIVRAACAMRGAQRNKSGQAAFDLRGFIAKISAGAALAALALLDGNLFLFARH